MLTNKKGLNGMIIGVLTIVIVVASVTILWGFISLFFTSAETSGYSAIAGLLKLFSPQEKDTAPENVVNNQRVYNLSCNDTDSMYELQGIERFVLGNVTILNGTYSEVYSDYCIDNSTLLEYYCINNTMYSSKITCEGENSCTEGRCDVGNLEYACYDSDSAEELQDYEKFKFGDLNLFNQDYNISFDYIDRCVNESAILELSCVNSTDGEYLEIDCGANSRCDNLTGACTCGNNEGVCCPVGIGLDECNDGLTCSSGVCVVQQISASCGNGIPETGEACDDWNNDNCLPYPGCKSDCSREQRCGNGISECGEQCDDGNNINIDACDNNCERTCGNGICDPWEICATCNLDCGSCFDGGGLPCQELGNDEQDQREHDYARLNDGGPCAI